MLLKPRTTLGISLYLNSPYEVRYDIDLACNGQTFQGLKTNEHEDLYQGISRVNFNRNKQKVILIQKFHKYEYMYTTLRLHLIIIIIITSFDYPAVRV